MYKSISILLFVSLFFSCNNEEINDSASVPEKAELSKSQMILNEAFQAHGGDLYQSAHYSFVFRGNRYEFKNEGDSYVYSKTMEKGDSTIVDFLSDGLFTRKINGVEVELTEKETKLGTEAINSVLYFATLPSKLLDKSVNTRFVETTLVKGQNYDVLEITFDQEGGGEDHEDEYYYWINQETKKIDYLAYNYLVNEGGVRFRSAFNSRVVDGITFQDYINYKAEVGTPLRELPALFEEGKLTELSQIKTGNVMNLKGK